jgi:hypothetical protein
MSLFRSYRAKRRDDHELGTGVWRRAHDRYVRGLDRYHQVLESADGDVYDELVLVANALSSGLPRVRAVCAEAQRVSPSDGMDIPGGSLTGLHRCLSKAGNLLATAGEAAAMTTLDSARTGSSQQSLESVRRRADAVLQELDRAEDIVHSR